MTTDDEALAAAWAKLGPDVDPAFALSGDLSHAHRDGRIDDAEFKLLKAAMARRDKQYKDDLGYVDDEEAEYDEPLL